MTNYEQYLFDLNGYVIVQGALTAGQVSAMNEAIDHNRDKIHIRTREQTLDGSLEDQGGRPADGLRGAHGRGDFGGFFFWEEPWGKPFRELIAAPFAMHAMLATIGPRFRLAGTAGITMTKGSEGFIFHGGGTPEQEHMNECFYHRFKNGRMRNGLMSVSYALTDASPEDGGFACIPASHKANYLCPLEVRRLEMDLGCVKYIPLKAGDAVIFTEALTHGTVPWKASFERRLLRYLYAPAIHTGGFSGGEFAAYEDELTPLQRVMVAPSSFPGDIDIAALVEADTAADRK
jgi:hypothetical protein